MIDIVRYYIIAVGIPSSQCAITNSSNAYSMLLTRMATVLLLPQLRALRYYNPPSPCQFTQHACV